MGIVIVLLIVGALIAGVVWNHKNRALAVDGVEFSLPASPAAVGAAIRSSYLEGAKAKLRAKATGLQLTQVSDGMHYQTKLGDTGQLVVRAGASGSVIQAATTELFIGHPWARREHRGIWALSVMMSHGIFRMVGLAPGAAKLKRFQAGIEGRLSKELEKAASGA